MYIHVPIVSADNGGRYAYNRQPRVCRWNLGKLAEALSSCLSEEATQEGLRVWDTFPVYNVRILTVHVLHVYRYDAEFEKSYLTRMRQKVNDVYMVHAMYMNLRAYVCAVGLEEATGGWQWSGWVSTGCNACYRSVSTSPLLYMMYVYICEPYVIEQRESLESWDNNWRVEQALLVVSTGWFFYIFFCDGHCTYCNVLRVSNFACALSRLATSNVMSLEAHLGIDNKIWNRVTWNVKHIGQTQNVTVEWRVYSGYWVHELFPCACTVRVQAMDVLW